MASLTKMMTLTLVLEAVARRAPLSDIITASEYAASKGQPHLVGGREQMTVEELLYAIAVGSANDAAVAVAEYVAGSELDFVARMNQRAQELGLANSHFLNSTGLPPENGPEHTMTARDAATLARHVLSVPGMMDYVSTYEYTMRKSTTRIPVLWNSNKLLRRYSGVDGIKTGFTTAAGYCMAATAVRDGLRLIAVVLGSPSEAAREEDVRPFWITASGATTVTSGSQRASFWQHLCVERQPHQVEAALGEDFTVTVERGREGEIRLEADLAQTLRAPLEPGTEVGTLRAPRQ